MRSFMLKKTLILLAILLLCPTIFAKENTQKLIKHFKSMNIYYYYMPNLNIETFTLPTEVKSSEDYKIFIYDKEIPTKKITETDRLVIKDEPGFYFSMLISGIENQPTYFVNKYFDYNSNEFIIDACKLEKGNWQTKYILNPETDKFVKQVKFNNGRFGITSLCNPDYVPFHDV